MTITEDIKNHFAAHGYVIQNKISKSSDYAIYTALNASDQLDVVIKILAAKYPPKLQTAKLHNEFYIQKKLSSEVAPKAISYHELNYGRSAMVSEQYGVSLSSYLSLQNNGTLSIEEFYPIVYDIIDKLDLLHEKGFIHKDLNPKNILVDPHTLKTKIIDFGLTSDLRREHQKLNLTAAIEGSLAYMSPEQTGRMNRDVDYRSDYYSLGISLYELLSGNRPFHSSDPLELIHSHISKKPKLLDQVNNKVPRPLALIIDKLISKNAEERYQSCFGLRKDLSICQSMAEEDYLTFQCGKYDVSTKLITPQNLYGREHEINILESLLNKITHGTIEFCCVAGYSGLGKTALVNELGRKVGKHNGFLISGKFDQYKQNSSYAAILQAFSGLVNQLLLESNNRFEYWREKILHALRGQGQVIVDLIPELEIIIGKQDPVQKLLPRENQNRFFRVVESFISVFASSEHPLVIFLDDLQWSDIPSIDLIHRIVTSNLLSHCLLIGTYRDNEIHDAHPLAMRLKDVEQEKNITYINLSPLSDGAIQAMVYDTVPLAPKQANKLSTLLIQKTGGNPFFTIELLKSLYRNEAIYFDRSEGKWHCKFKEINNYADSENVVDLLIANLSYLAPDTQRALQLASCIGTTFDLETISIFYDDLPSQASSHLKEALIKNFIIASDDSYRYANLIEDSHDYDGELNDSQKLNLTYSFQHDRVQQAAYSLVPEKNKASLHLSIGNIFLKQLETNRSSEKLFETVGHLNMASDLFKSQDQKRKVAELNLRAGIKASQSSAYEEAIIYLTHGLDQLGEEKWTHDYELSWSLSDNLQKCFYLTGKWEQADEWATTLLDLANSDILRAQLMVERTRQYATMGRMDKSLQVAYRGLQYLGLTVIENPSKKDTQAIKDKIDARLSGIKIASLIGLPPMVDERALIASQLYMEVFAAAFLSGAGEKFPYLVMSAADLSLEHGSSPSSAFSFAAYGMLLCGFLNQAQLGNEFGKLGIEMIERYEDIALKSRIYYVYTMFVSHWSNHWSTMTPLFKKGIEYGYKSGDLLYLAYSAQDCIIWDPKLDLKKAAVEHKSLLQIVKECEYQDSFDSGTLFYQMQLNFLGQTDGLYSISNDQFDEDACVEGMKTRGFKTGIANYYIYKSEVHLLYNDYEGALTYILPQEGMRASTMSLPQQARFSIISFLVYSANLHLPVCEKRDLFNQRLEDKLKEMSHWAEVCEANFLHLKYFMTAEIKSLKGETLHAVEDYERAIQLAKKYAFRRDEAMINEFAAMHLLRNQLEKAAEGYLKSSLHLYYDWGAVRKVQQLLESYSNILDETHPTYSSMISNRDRTRQGTHSISEGALDIESLFKASQKISGELVLSHLLNSILDILVENAGADKGLLLELKQGDFEIISHVSVSQEKEGNRQFPKRLVTAAMRKKTPIVIHNLSTSELYAQDPYVLDYSPRSAMCIPIHSKGEFSIAIYLENNITHSAFNESRVRFLKLLASQASVSLHNARLYEQRENLLTAQKRFVPKQFLRHLGHENIGKVALGEAIVLNMSVLFSDIRNFTPLVETLSPDRVIELLNDYYTELGIPITEHGGFIDSFAGDQIMALFADSHLNAVKAGIQMRRSLENYNLRENPKGQQSLKMGIGINSGELVLGTMGSTNRIQCTVIGDTVNLASRLESLTKYYGAALLIGENTYNAIVNESDIQFRLIDYTAVKGKSQAIKIYEVLDAELEERKFKKLATLDIFSEGLSLYQGRSFEEALDRFTSAYNLDSDDQILKIYIERCKEYIANPPNNSSELVTYQKQK